MKELRIACLVKNRDPYAPLPKKFQHLFKGMPSADMQKANKGPVTKVKTSKENPSSATATGTEDAKSSQGAPVIEVSDSFSRDKVTLM